MLEPARLSSLLCAAALAAAPAGCGKPNRSAVFPPGALRVRYEYATTHSTCLVACVAMASNYLFNEARFSETRILSDIRKKAQDETSTAALKAYLGERGLFLVTLSGQLDDKPPEGLRYWLQDRGYPVICVINRDPVDAGFNHAVVVIGISENCPDRSADIIHYFDPSAAEPLQSVDAVMFSRLWARGQNAMMIVVQPQTAPPVGG